MVLSRNVFVSGPILEGTRYPTVRAAWRLLQCEDVDGAAALAGALGDDRADAPDAVQLRAAIAAFQGQVATAREILATALDHVTDVRAAAYLSLLLGLCLEDEGVDLAAAKLALERAGDVCGVEAREALARVIWSVDGATAGEAAFRDAAMTDSRPTLWLAWAERLAAQDDEREIAILREALELYPGDPTLALALATTLSRRRRYLAAFEVCNTVEAIAEMPELLLLRGVSALGAEKFANAFNDLSAVLKNDPDNLDVRLLRGKAALEVGRLDEAEGDLRLAAEQDPEDDRVRVGVAAVAYFTGRMDEYEAFVSENPDLELESCRTIGGICMRRHLYCKAFQIITRARELDPDDTAALTLYDRARLCIGDVRGGLERDFEAAEGSSPCALGSANSALFNMHYDEKRTPDELVEFHKRFGSRFFGGGDADWSFVFSNVPDPERPLKIGLLSSDLRHHSVAFFMVALIDHYERSAYHITVYYTTEARDVATDWFEANVDCWRQVASSTEDELLALIRADKIDVLVDVAGYTAGHRMKVFGRRAAPVQISHIGYPDTTGIPEMDYRIVDHFTDPPGAEVYATECLVHLPRPFLCYATAEDIPDVASLPYERLGTFSFGCFNNVLKLNDSVYDVWSEILRQVPNARLLLKARQFGEPEFCDLMRERFASRGVDAERIVMNAQRNSLYQHLSNYEDVDLALDPFPYNGTTTTCEAFSMGVPVLGLKGDRHCARVGESLISGIGLADDFLAEDHEDYVRRAVGWAHRTDELAVLRQTLRPRLKASPLCDEIGYTRTIEAVFRQTWRVWCAGGPRHGIGPTPFEIEQRARGKQTVIDDESEAVVPSFAEANE